MTFWLPLKAAFPSDSKYISAGLATLITYSSTSQTRHNQICFEIMSFNNLPKTRLNIWTVPQLRSTAARTLIWALEVLSIRGIKVCVMGKYWEVHSLPNLWVPMSHWKWEIGNNGKIYKGNFEKQLYEIGQTPTPCNSVLGKHTEKFIVLKLWWKKP